MGGWGKRVLIFYSCWCKWPSNCFDEFSSFAIHLRGQRKKLSDRKGTKLAIYAVWISHAALTKHFTVAKTLSNRDRLILWIERIKSCLKSLILDWNKFTFFDFPIIVHAPFKCAGFIGLQIINENRILFEQEQRYF